MGLHNLFDPFAVGAFSDTDVVNHPDPKWHRYVVLAQLAVLSCSWSHNSYLGFLMKEIAFR